MMKDWKTIYSVKGPKTMMEMTAVELMEAMKETKTIILSFGAIENHGAHLPLGADYEDVKADYLNLPAALFAQAQHLKSDEFTKLGLPVPLLSSINEDFASKLYSENYDALCFARDAKIVGVSFVVSKLFDIIISLTHGLFRGEDIDKDLYEVRTRKILLISNTIASTSTIINAAVTSNPKNLDIGSLLNTVTHLFTDVRFITRVKKEFIENEISKRTEKEISEIDALFENI